MHRSGLWFAALGLMLGLAAYAAEPAWDCKPMGRLVPICGLRGAEDLEVLPGGRALLVSQSRVDFSHPPAMSWLPGSIAVLDLATRKPRVLYPLPSSRPGSGEWGDAACPGEIGEHLSPHGMHLSRRADGRRQLLVVNHGGRESIEFFEVTGSGRKLGLEWRGCAVAPEFSFLNDVAALPQGGFLVTHMTRNDAPDAMMRDRAKAERGENTGHVWRWRSESGYSVLAGSESPMPNGIQVDASGTTLYLDIDTVAGGVRKIDIATGKTEGFVAVPNPDNISWSPDGHLLVAGITPDADVGPCLKAGFARPCGARSYVAEIDPATLDKKVVFEHAGPPLGLATVAVRAGRFLYVGSAAGDRVLRVPLNIAR